MTYVARQKSIAYSYNSSLNVQACFDIDDSDPEQIVMVQNNIDLATQQPGQPIAAGRFVQFAFSTEFRGSLIAATGPPEGELWQAAGCAETGTTGKTYTAGDTRLSTGTPAGATVPLDITLNTGGSTTTSGRYIDAKSAVCNAMLVMEAGSIPYIRWTVLGQLDAADATPTTSGLNEAVVPASYRGSLPVAVQGESCSLTLSTAGALTTPIIHRLQYDLGNVLARRPSFNATDSGFGPPIINGRNPTAEIVVEVLQGVALEDAIMAGEFLTVSLTHNDGGGIREEAAITFSGYFADSHKIGEQDGASTYVISLIGKGNLAIAYIAS